MKQIRKSTIDNFVNNINECISSGLSRAAFCAHKQLYATYFSVNINKILEGYKEGIVAAEDFNRVIESMSKLDSKYEVYKSETAHTNAASPVQANIPFEEETLEQVSIEPDDDRNSVNIIRDDNGKIKFYEFKVLRRDKAPLVGRLTRDEMNNIYRMYSYYGMSITQREISRYFPEYSLIDFKRILRVFSITKAVSPFAPHIIEEHSKEELMDMQMREKENDFLRGIEEQSIKNDRALLKKYAIENIELKRKLEEGVKIDLSGLDLASGKPFTPTGTPSKKNLFLYLSDMHIGAYVSPLSIYSNPYDKDEVIRRINIILNRVHDLHETYKGFDNIYVCNLGDSLDGYNGQTTRGGHSLPQNMCNKEQIHTFIFVMNYLFTELNKLEYNKMHYYCVGESNHDGDFGYAANVALETILANKGVNCTIFDKFIGEFKAGETTFILCHGKDNKDMFKNLPLTLNIKTENFINEYLDTKGISGNVIFIKGDLHQSATTYGRRFTYRSVGSLFGSSEWMHKNFGNTCWSCDYSIVDETGNRLDGLITAKS